MRCKKVKERSRWRIEEEVLGDEETGKEEEDKEEGKEVKGNGGGYGLRKRDGGVEENMEEADTEEQEVEEENVEKEKME